MDVVAALRNWLWSPRGMRDIEAHGDEDGPVGAGKGSPYAAGVSCATASNCAVTGVAISDVTSSGADLAAFTEIWNGRAWQLGRAV
jgi:hypothetical protein